MDLDASDYNIKAQAVEAGDNRSVMRYGFKAPATPGPTETQSGDGENGTKTKETAKPARLT